MDGGFRDYGAMRVMNRRGQVTAKSAFHIAAQREVRERRKSRFLKKVLGIRKKGDYTQFVWPQGGFGSCPVFEQPR